MGTKFNQCPNCGKTPSPGVFGKGVTDVYECKKCGTVFCYKHCGTRCPNCASKEKKKIGYTMSR